MERRATEAFEAVMNILLAVPWNERAEIVAAVRNNDIFCTYCGVGTRLKPNPNCYCNDDE
jgi:hypothetical protein